MKTASVKQVLLCFVFLMAFSAVPVESQPALLTNPSGSDLAACGLPPSRARFTSAATVTTFTMTADCAISNSQVEEWNAFLRFVSGEFTINGNGHSISGPTNAYVIWISVAGAVLNLNDVTIRTGGEISQQAILASGGGRLNARNVIFENGHNASPVMAYNNGQVYLEDATFLNNRKSASAFGDYGSAASSNHLAGSYPDTLLSITNAVFEGNSGAPVLGAARGAIRLQGCLIFRDNIISGSTPAADYATYNGGTVIDRSSNQNDRSRCPSPKKKEETPAATPTATPRPAYAASYIALQTETGMTFTPTYGLDSGVHFRQLDGAGIGVQSIIDAGYLAALDVYGYVEQGVEVCFPQAGRLLFLDARTMPRTIVPLESTLVNGMTCASISSPGSLVLMPLQQPR